MLFYFIGGQKVLKWIREIGREHASCVQMTDVTVQWQVILGACAKLLKVTIGFVMSVHLSVCQRGTTRLLRD